MATQLQGVAISCSVHQTGIGKVMLMEQEAIVVLCREFLHSWF